jgi:hypothetical protein
MLRVKANFIAYLIVVCFALLQVLSPFIHAHLDTEHPTQNTGFHVGDAHEEKIINLVHAESDFLSAAPHAAHTISVASGITQDIDSTLHINTSLLVLFFLCFPLALTYVLKQFFPLSLIPLQPLKRRIPASRAPPQL